MPKATRGLYSQLVKLLFLFRWVDKRPYNQTEKLLSFNS